ncbi:MAG: ABC transporter ATP-binding protein [Limnochordia bacterium]|jgi:ATP-binding cassette subfamily B protein|nr:ABC transporter ATP-binding protein [Bacillota bacterium]HOB07830.1 ABC transporter ATP-binding protein [Limnochordia bacterium]NLH31123.1 ABC transporter ATP-binding protein [Bacillota bacterium]HPT93565.1 ABC transporter ATP-binding protein [Limnochordia bacterium]HPZ30016.1 ABC transporter ATP-binding protein [Limnochordia bacterium]
MHFKRLIAYSRKYLGLNIAASILSIGAVIAGLYIPVTTKDLVDRVLVAGEFDVIGSLTVLLAGLTVVRIVFEYLRSYIFEYTSQKVLYDFRSDLYRKLLNQSFSYYDQVRTGTLMNRLVGDLQAVRELLSSFYIQVFEGLFQIVTTLAMMISFSAPMTLALVVIVPVTYFTMRAMSARLRPVYREVRVTFEDLSSTVQENLTGIRVVKAFGREEFEKDKLDQVAVRWNENNILAADIRSVYIPVRRLISGFSTVIILLLGGYLVIRGRITLGVLVAFNAYVGMLSGPINNASQLVNQWENAKASLEKVFELMDETPMLANKSNALSKPDCRGEIEFRHVNFNYGEQMVLQDVSFVVKPGTTTAIMGSTGSGKSTILNLIARFYDCTEGEVLVDGINVQEYDYNDLRRHIGIVFQETFLFSDTIANNIAFAVPNAPREQIEQAAKIAGAHEFIVQMPDGYDTIIGERGIGLSGGQRQRIAIARAIITNPKILILDDATSSVDMETEHQIQQTLKGLMHDRTVLIVAHRISSVKDADQILVLENGRIVERGTHQELIRLGGRYYRTFIEQYSEYKANAGGLELVSGRIG